MTTIQDAADAEAWAELTTPRPISEYDESMGDVLWWCWEPPRPFKRINSYVIDSGHNGQWKGEAPYVGSPNDCGQTVEIETVISTVDGKQSSSIRNFDVGGWPGYHTHFTPIPTPITPTWDTASPPRGK